MNYLLSTCATAKLPVLAYETILKYSGSETNPQKLALWKVDKNHSNIKEDISSVNQAASTAQNVPVAVDRAIGPAKKIFSLPTLHPESYDIAMKVCGSSGDIATAYKIAQLMKSKRISITTDGWNSVLNAVMFLLITFYSTTLNCSYLFYLMYTTPFCPLSREFTPLILILFAFFSRKFHVFFYLLNIIFMLH